MYKNFFKRFIDVILALIGLVVVLPIFFCIGFILFGINKGQSFFIQERPGKHGKLFKVIKFKTMNDNRDSLGKLLPDEQRLTRIGSFVRSTSIDEIPQLINVLKGDMSYL